MIEYRRKVLSNGLVVLAHRDMMIEDYNYAVKYNYMISGVFVK